MCEQTETETEPEATPRVAFATILQSLADEARSAAVALLRALDGDA